MKTDIFHLQIIPTQNILPHEEFDQSRAIPLVKKIKKEQILVNPILVTPLSKNKFLQLDGMNRFCAFKILGLKTILCQVIDYNDQETVELSSWIHLFNSVRGKFFKFIDSIEGLNIKEGSTGNVGHRYIKEEGFGRLCTLCSKDKRVYLVSCNGDLVDKIAALNKLVSYYKKNIVRDVLPPSPHIGDIELLFKEHEETNMIVVFPTFTRHQIIEAVKKGNLFPAGITRHIIKRRCLNLNIPLAMFDKNKTPDELNREFEKMLHDRNFRLYEEPTIYFE